MSDTDGLSEYQDAAVGYEIRLTGYLDDRWADWFDGLTITRDASGDTLLTGPVADQAALHGELRRVRDLGIPLVSVARITLERRDAPAADDDHDQAKKETDR